MRRKRKKNPGGLTLLLVGGGVLAAAVVGVLLFEKKANALPASLAIPNSPTGQGFNTAPAFVGMSAGDAAGLIAGDCITAVQNAAGFHVDAGNIPTGSNVLLKVLVPSTNGLPLTASLIDPRATPAGQAPSAMSVPIAALSGAGTC